MRRLLTTLIAFLALVLGGAHAGAMAAAVPALPAVAEADALSAEPPCHSMEAEAAVAEADSDAPDCCPDGCDGGCVMLAALPAPNVDAPPVGVHGERPQALRPGGERPRPGAAPAPDSHGDGLKRPPRPAA